MKIKKVPSYYTPEQAIQYLAHIKYLSPPSLHDLKSNSFPTTLENLTTIVRLHLIAFPCENIAMHYSEHHSMDVSPEGIFQRMVLEGKGLGSYCYGQNGLLLGVLRALGYRAFASTGRVNIAPGDAPPEFTPIAHMVVFVQPDPTPDGARADTVYVVDVGFGAAGPARPVPLEDGALVPGSAPPEEHRLVRGRHPESALVLTTPPPPADADADADAGGDDAPDPAGEWRLEHRCGAHQPGWRVLYQFSGAESFVADHSAQSFAVSARPGTGPFWDTVLCVAHFPTPDGHLGRMVLTGTRVDRRVGDVSETLAEVATDVERLRALKKFFGVDVPEEAAAHIRGRVPALG